MISSLAPILLLLSFWLGAMVAVTDRKASLMLSQSEVVPASQGCKCAEKVAAGGDSPSCWCAAQRQLHSSSLPGCHPIMNSEQTQGM